MREIKVNYILEIKDKLMKVKGNAVSEEEINEIICDIRIFLVNR